MTPQYAITDTISPDLLNKGKELTMKSQSVVEVTNEAQLQLAAQVGQALHIHIQKMKADLDRVLKPALSFEKVIRQLWRESLEPAVEQKARISNLTAAFRDQEKKRVENEEKAKSVEFQRLEVERRKAMADSIVGGLSAQIAADQLAQQLEAQSRAVITAPISSPLKAEGMRVTKELCFEVTNPMALVAARPDLCRIEPNVSAIKASCDPSRPIPGLRLWHETKTHFTK